MEFRPEYDPAETWYERWERKTGFRPDAVAIARAMSLNNRRRTARWQQANRPRKRASA